MVIAVDFDGTIVEHAYPQIGKERPFAFETLRAISRDGHKLILWTARSGKLLDEAIEYCRKNGVEFYAVNSNEPPNALFAGSSKLSGKVMADVYIDDRNIGGLPDWGTIYEIIIGKHEDAHRRKRKRWSLFKKR
ncbi:MAG: hypothetical protein IKW89_13030 [Bacteroidales bacterium]|nr:hypothetical protein [Bacteroidales bacterium]